MKQFFSITMLSIMLVSCGGGTKTADSTVVTAPASDSLGMPAASTTDTTKVSSPDKDVTSQAVEATTERIDMAKEGPSIVWEQEVAANSSKSFVFYAKKGQQLLLNLIDDTNEGTMDLGKATIIEPNSEGSYETTIEVTKDYMFTVSNNSNKATSFRISMTLETP